MCVSAFQTPLLSVWHFNLVTTYFMLLPWAVNCSWGAGICRPHDQATTLGWGAWRAGAGILFNPCCRSFIVEPFKSKMSEWWDLRERIAALFSLRIMVTSQSVSSAQGRTASAYPYCWTNTTLFGKKMGNFSGIGKFESISSVTISWLPGII